MASSRLTARALLDLKIPHSPHLSPDGRRVVFCVYEADWHESRWVSRLWLADVPDGNPRQVTFSYEGERAPRWSPDGQHIAFLSTRPDLTEPPPPPEQEEAEMHKEQVWIMPVHGGEAWRLTSAGEGVRAFQWAPDGKTLLFLAPEPRPQPSQFARDDARKRRIDPVVEQEDRLRMQFWEVDLHERRPVLLHTGDFGVSEFDLAPDGRRLVYATNRTGDPNDYHQLDLFLVDLDTGEAHCLLDSPGGKFGPRWSPDGARIVWLANRDPATSFSQECVWEMPGDGGAPRNLFHGVPWDAHELLFAPADGALLALVADGVCTPAVVVADPPARLAGTETGECTALDARAAETVVVVWEDEKTPPELFALGPGGQRLPLTDLNRAFRERFTIPPCTPVRWRSADGLEIEGLLTLPPAEDGGQPARGPHPLLVQVHGGPKGRAVATLRSYYLHALFAAEGYAVLQPNYRGSEGYGNAFAVMSRRDLGGGDFQDILAGIDWAVAQGVADPGRLAIMGASYGGYMAAWAVARTSRFRAAISQFGIFNLVTDYGCSDVPRWDVDYLGAHYWEDPEIYRRCSPSTYVDRISTPMLILHGQADGNTFISNSRELYQALRARGVPVEFVHYPREGHGLREPGHRLDELRRCLAWLDQHLRPEAPARRPGGPILHDGYELNILRLDDGEFAGWHDDWGRLLEVVFGLASQDPVDSAWTLDLAQVRLVDTTGAPCELKGVAVDAGGGRTVVSGESLWIDVHPDRDTGRLSLAVPVVFVIPPQGGEFALHIADFPPVRVQVGPCQDEPEREGEENPPAGEAPALGPSLGPPTPPPADEGPPVAPQRAPRPGRPRSGRRG